MQAILLKQKTSVYVAYVTYFITPFKIRTWEWKVEGQHLWSMLAGQKIPTKDYKPLIANYLGSRDDTVVRALAWCHVWDEFVVGYHLAYCSLPPSIKQKKKHFK